MNPVKMMTADKTHHDRIVTAVKETLVAPLRNAKFEHEPVAKGLDEEHYRIGDIEDANVLIQNSLWQNVPLGQLHLHKQLTELRDRTSWAPDQIEKIKLFGRKFHEIATYIISRI